MEDFSAARFLIPQAWYAIGIQIALQGIVLNCDDDLESLSD